jgi:hypothetical protein
MPLRILTTRSLSCLNLLALDLGASATWTTAPAAGNFSAQKICAPLRTESDLSDSQSEVGAAKTAKAKARGAKRQKRMMMVEEFQLRTGSTVWDTKVRLKVKR